MSTGAQRTKVIYISGSARSGSTVLSKALGELNHTFSAGELRLIWKRSYINGEPCGCREAFRDCAVWRPVTERAFGGFDGVDAEWMIRNIPRQRTLPLMLIPGSERVIARPFQPFVEQLDRFYHSIAETTGCRVIVDSSKLPVYGYMLRLLPSVDVHVVHLVRDPRGTQYSWVRRQQRGDERFEDHSVSASSVQWAMLNVSHELMSVSDRQHYLRLRYEDFIKDPILVIERIKTFIGEPNLGLPRIVDGQIHLSPNHIVAGSENRSEAGTIPLHLDDRWRTELDARSRSTVTRLTFPLLHRYGYS